MDNFPYPTIEAILAEWDQLYQVVKGGLKALPQEVLARELSFSAVAGHGILDSTIGVYGLL